MPADIKVLIDEDTHLALAEALRRRGYDAIHVRELERLGVDDLSQLEFAAYEGRCFLTCNIGEFVVLHGSFVNEGREHFGIVVSAQKPVGRMLREMLTFLQSHTANEIQSQVFFL